MPLTDMPLLDTVSPAFQRKLEGFLQTHWGRPVVVSDFHRFPSGMSWITIAFTARAGQGDAKAQRLILRVGDPAGILAPYRAAPEFQSLSALAGVPGLPIPRVHAFSEDASILGAPFIVSEWVAGDTPRPFEGAEPVGDAAEIRSMCQDFIDALGAIHLFDATGSALTEPGLNTANAAIRQVERWAAHAHIGQAGAQPQMRYAAHWLKVHAPVADRITVVHGDYRVGNFLQQGGRITAILDWELVHLGDPHEDLAWAGLRAYAAGTNRIGGMLERSAFHEGYKARTGFAVRPEVIRYYEVLGQFKLAAMFIGAVQRVEAGVARDVRMGAIGLHLAPMLMELNRLIEVAS